MPIALLIPLLAPVVTELFKWFTSSVISDNIIKELPSTLLPAVSTAAGGLLTMAAPMIGIDLGVDPAIGAALGLAGTGVHQTVSMVREKSAPATEA